MVNKCNKTIIESISPEGFGKILKKMIQIRIIRNGDQQRRVRVMSSVRPGCGLVRSPTLTHELVSY